MLWLYWKNDKYWGEDYPKQWYQAWVAGGAQARFVAMASSGSDGHAGMRLDMDHWLPVVDAFLAQLGFDKPAIIAKPAATDYANIADAGKVPVSAQIRATGYAKFLESKPPRAFAIGDNGAWGYATGDYATGRALGYCQHSGQSCKLYAVDDKVVWREDLEVKSPH